MELVRQNDVKLLIIIIIIMDGVRPCVTIEH